MEQKLKMSTGRAVVMVVLLLIVLVLDVYLIYECIVADMFFLNLFDFSSVIGIVVGLFVVIYGIVLIYNSTAKALTFNDKEFTYKGKTYGYHNIENIKIIGGRFGNISYNIRVNGKNLYVFDNEYEGAIDFLACLNFHNVIGTPRG